MGFCSRPYLPHLCLPSFLICSVNLYHRVPSNSEYVWTSKLCTALPHAILRKIASQSSPDSKLFTVGSDDDIWDGKKPQLDFSKSSMS